jgi:hypothetical protein
MIKMVNISFQDLLGQNIGLGTTATTGSIIVSLLISFIISMFIYYIYKKTYTGVLYSENFNISLVLICMITTSVMVAISGNLALSLGMVGALSIVRFRTAVKDPKDVIFIFWAITIGIINGIAFYKLSLSSSIMIGAIIYLMTKNAKSSYPYLIVISFTSLDENKLNKMLDKYCRKHSLRNKELSNEGNELVVEVRLKKDVDHTILNELQKLKGIDKIRMFSHTGDVSE